jgi:hypothetical protein
MRPGVEIRFLPGRLKFGGLHSGAPFPSVVVIFHAKAMNDHTQSCSNAAVVADETTAHRRQMNRNAR